MKIKYISVQSTYKVVVCLLQFFVKCWYATPDHTERLILGYSTTKVMVITSDMSA